MTKPSKPLMRRSLGDIKAPRAKMSKSDWYWLLFHFTLAGIILSALTLPVPDGFQYAGLILLGVCWIPKTLWNHRTVFIENKMTTLASLVGLAAIISGVFVYDPDFKPQGAWYGWLFALWFSCDSGWRYLRKKHGSF